MGGGARFARVRAAMGAHAAGVVALALLASLLAPAAVRAAEWQGPLLISSPTTVATDAKIALGPSGDAGAVWQTDGTGGVVEIARRAAGGTWSAPLAFAPAPRNPLFIAVDGAGALTVVYARPTDTIVATWAPADAAPTLDVIPMPLRVEDLAVDAAGDAVLAALDVATSELVLAYRRGPAGAFELDTTAGANSFTFSARVAINTRGTAVVVAIMGPFLMAATRTPTGDWPGALEGVETVEQVGAAAVGIDGAGNVLAAYEYRTAAFAAILRTARRPAAGGAWLRSGDLTSGTAQDRASPPAIAVSDTGAAAVVWDEIAAHTSRVEALYGTTAAGFATPAEHLTAAVAACCSTSFGHRAAIAADGSVVAAWTRYVDGGTVDEASARSAGLVGTWGTTHALDAAHPVGPGSSLSGDGLGDYAALVVPSSGAASPVVLSTYDGAPPVITAADPPRSIVAGTAAHLTASARDSWSSVGVPTWTFGDGTGGDGLAVSHAYTRPGSYVAHVTVADGSGNVASVRVPLVVTAERGVLTSARFAARWRQSRVRGALRVAGTAPVAGTYAVDVSTAGKRRLHVSLKLGQGAFSRTLALPGTLLPGSYRVALLPASTLLEGSSLLAKLAAPVEGVADLASFSRRRSGAATRTVQDASSLWARFHLAAVPQGKPLTLTWYRLVEGKRVAVRTVTRKPAAHIRDSLAVRGLRGTITVILTRSGKVILQRSALVRSTVGPRVARGSPGTSRPG